MKLKFNRNLILFFLAASIVMLFGLSHDVFAQSQNISVNIPLSGQGGDRIATPIKVVLILTFLTFLPAILLSATSFTRIIVVFSFLRQALGLQSSPPNQVVVGLSLFMTFAIMSPVFTEMNTRGVAPYMDGKIDEKQALTEILDPLRRFMYAQTRTTDLNLMMDIARTEKVDDFSQLPTSVLIPAFILSELKTAFEIGFMIYIPFVVIDMVVSMVLLALGMMVLPPVVISMPFKIMLFVVVDGWDLVVSSLVRSFK